MKDNYAERKYFTFWKWRLIFEEGRCVGWYKCA